MQRNGAAPPVPGAAPGAVPPSTVGGKRPASEISTVDEPSQGMDVTEPEESADTASFGGEKPALTRTESEISSGSASLGMDLEGPPTPSAARGAGPEDGGEGTGRGRTAGGASTPKGRGGTPQQQSEVDDLLGVSLMAYPGNLKHEQKFTKEAMESAAQIEKMRTTGTLQYIIPAILEDPKFTSKLKGGGARKTLQRIDLLAKLHQMIVLARLRAIAALSMEERSRRGFEPESLPASMPKPRPEIGSEEEEEKADAMDEEGEKGSDGVVAVVAVAESEGIKSEAMDDESPKEASKSMEPSESVVVLESVVTAAAAATLKASDAMEAVLTAEDSVMRLATSSGKGDQNAANKLNATLPALEAKARIAMAAANKHLVEVVSVSAPNSGGAAGGANAAPELKATFNGMSVEEISKQLPMGNVRPSWTKPCPWWDAMADAHLILGTYRHGFAKYELMKADPELCFRKRLEEYAAMQTEAGASASGGASGGAVAKNEVTGNLGPALDPASGSVKQRRITLPGRRESEFRGVYAQPGSTRWVVQAKLAVHPALTSATYVGTFDTEEQAARAYDEFVRKSNGDATLCNYAIDGTTRNTAAPPAEADSGSTCGLPWHRSSKYRGVRASGSKWTSQIRLSNLGGLNHHLGTFATELEAAVAYDNAAMEHHGANAVLNFPKGLDEELNRLEETGLVSLELVDRDAALPYRPHRPLPYGATQAAQAAAAGQAPPPVRTPTILTVTIAPSLPTPLQKQQTPTRVPSNSLASDSSDGKGKGSDSTGDGEGKDGAWDTDGAGASSGGTGHNVGDGLPMPDVRVLNRLVTWLVTSPHARMSQDEIKVAQEEARRMREQEGGTAGDRPGDLLGQGMELDSSLILSQPRAPPKAKTQSKMIKALQRLQEALNHEPVALPGHLEGRDLHILAFMYRELRHPFRSTSDRLLCDPHPDHHVQPRPTDQVNDGRTLLLQGTSASESETQKALATMLDPERDLSDMERLFRQLSRASSSASSSGLLLGAATVDGSAVVSMDLEGGDGGAGAVDSEKIWVQSPWGEELRAFVSAAVQGDEKGDGKGMQGFKGGKNQEGNSLNPNEWASSARLRRALCTYFVRYGVPPEGNEGKTALLILKSIETFQSQDSLEFLESAHKAPLTPAPPMQVAPATSSNSALSNMNAMSQNLSSMNAMAMMNTFNAMNGMNPMQAMNLTAMNQMNQMSQMMGGSAVAMNPIMGAMNMGGLSQVQTPSAAAQAAAQAAAGLAIVPAVPAVPEAPTPAVPEAPEPELAAVAAAATSAPWPPQPFEGDVAEPGQDSAPALGNDIGLAAFAAEAAEAVEAAAAAAEAVAPGTEAPQAMDIEAGDAGSTADAGEVPGPADPAASIAAASASASASTSASASAPSSASVEAPVGSDAIAPGVAALMAAVGETEMSEATEIASEEPAPAADDNDGFTVVTHVTVKPRTPEPERHAPTARQAKLAATAAEAQAVQAAEAAKAAEIAEADRKMKEEQEGFKRGKKGESKRKVSAQTFRYSWDHVAKALEPVLREVSHAASCLWDSCACRICCVKYVVSNMLSRSHSYSHSYSYSHAYSHAYAYSYSHSQVNAQRQQRGMSRLSMTGESIRSYYATIFVPLATSLMDPVYFDSLISDKGTEANDAPASATEAGVVGSAAPPPSGPPPQALIHAAHAAQGAQSAQGVQGSRPHLVTSLALATTPEDESHRIRGSIHTTMAGHTERVKPQILKDLGLQVPVMGAALGASGEGIAALGASGEPMDLADPMTAASAAAGSMEAVAAAAAAVAAPAAPEEQPVVPETLPFEGPMVDYPDPAFPLQQHSVVARRIALRFLRNVQLLRLASTRTCTHARGLSSLSLSRPRFCHPGSRLLSVITCLSCVTLSLTHVCTCACATCVTWSGRFALCCAGEGMQPSTTSSPRTSGIWAETCAACPAGTPCLLAPPLRLLAIALPYLVTIPYLAPGACAHVKYLRAMCLCACDASLCVALSQVVSMGARHVRALGLCTYRAAADRP